MHNLEVLYSSYISLQVAKKNGLPKEEKTSIREDDAKIKKVTLIKTVGGRTMFLKNVNLSSCSTNIYYFVGVRYF